MALTCDPEVLRSAIVRDGAILVRGVLPVQDVEAARADIERVLVELGWVGDDLRARTCPSVGSPHFAVGYSRLQSLESFHALVTHPRLTSIMESILSGPVFAHPNRQVRITCPDDPQTEFHTRPHQDFPVFRVTSDVLTAWVPLHDCDDRRSPLLILERSHLDGYIRPTPGSTGSGVYVETAASDPGWRALSCEAGDVVLFHSFTVHAAGPNRTDRMRLSAVVRYQRTDEPILRELLAPHGLGAGSDWAALTAGWASERPDLLPAEVPVVDEALGRPSEDVLRLLQPPASRLLPGFRSSASPTANA